MKSASPTPATAAVFIAALALPVLSWAQSAAEPTPTQGKGLAPAPSVAIVAPPEAPLAPEPEAQLTGSMWQKGAQPLLFGRSGQLYIPSENDTWKRDQAGGIAVDVQAIWLYGSSLFAIGDRSPLFERRYVAKPRVDESMPWSAFHLLHRGSIAVAEGRNLFAVGRHLYERRGDRWQRSRSISRPLRSLASARGSIVAIDETGQLVGGAALNRVLPMPSDDALVQVFVTDAKDVYALGSSGQLYLVEKRAQSLKLLPRNSPPQVRVARAVGDELWIIIQDEEGYRLARSKGSQVTEVVPLWTPAPGDEFSLLAPLLDGLLVGTRRGAALIWRENRFHSARILTTEESGPSERPGPARAATSQDA